MPYQIALSCEDRQGRICDAGNGMGGNLYETQACAEKIAALKYGAHDPWWYVAEVWPGFPVLLDSHVSTYNVDAYRRAPMSEDVPF